MSTGSRILATEFLYHFPVHEPTKRLLKTIRKQELIKAGDRVAVAVSGGADSVALLLLLLELRADLGIVLSVAHVNHKLRGQESDEDEHSVVELAHSHGLELHTRTAPLAAANSGIEAAARKLRYDFFRELTFAGRVSKVATAHTLDDQAETILLRILRGTGIRGLSGIHPRLVFEGKDEVVRPLLDFRRADLEAFLRDHCQQWREDSSNRDLAFLRNRVRHRLLPLLKEEFGLAAVENLADLAEIARAEEEHWGVAHPEIRCGHSQEIGECSLALTSFSTLPLAAQRRLIRTWLETNARDLNLSFRVIEEVRDLAGGPPGRKIELRGGHFVRRTQQDLCLEPASVHTAASDYEYRLHIPGEVKLPELGIRIEALLTEKSSVPEREREQLLDPDRVPKDLTVRNWRPGDRFWPAHTKEAKKVKELLNDHHIVGTAKARWPVVVAEGRGLVWMRGFLPPAEFASSSDSGTVLWIRVVAN
jgi:tRNA(Ile)-lysidine synthase